MGCPWSSLGEDVNMKKEMSMKKMKEEEQLLTPQTPKDSSKDFTPKFESLYTLGEPIGEGISSVVLHATHNESGKVYAVKCVDKSNLSAEDMEDVEKEVEILKRLDHDNLLHLIDYFSEEHYFFIVTELVEGGELFDRIVEKVC